MRRKRRDRRMRRWKNEEVQYTKKEGRRKQRGRGRKTSKEKWKEEEQ